MILPMRSRGSVFDEEPRIGVFVCHCGLNIASVVDVEQVTEAIAKEPFVVMATNSMFACSDASLSDIKEQIKEHRLNRVVVASCTPRTHEELFRDTPPCGKQGLTRFCSNSLTFVISAHGSTHQIRRRPLKKQLIWYACPLPGRVFSRPSGENHWRSPSHWQIKALKPTLLSGVGVLGEIFSAYTVPWKQMTFPRLVQISSIGLKIIPT